MGIIIIIIITCTKLNGYYIAAEEHGNFCKDIVGNYKYRDVNEFWHKSGLNIFYILKLWVIYYLPLKYYL